MTGFASAAVPLEITKKSYQVVLLSAECSLVTARWGAWNRWTDERRCSRQSSDTGKKESGCKEDGYLQDASEGCIERGDGEMRASDVSSSVH